MHIGEQDPCKVVVNHEGQYSIWPPAQENPPGWNDAGKEGTKRECLEWIDVNWTDMRPLSLRRLTEPAEHVTGNPQ
ncbi:MbtH family NRPS accessory protein [Planomonospora sp. ID67723]|uniref:MbtH family protein n=1 Tax=Planomonospora sp. ID67723 TaxID=2738134 RepID=UPI001A2F0524|nr:MbtH family NRPS accessory protein [Planomonospora sp. ID67723]MBG0833225.1 MbtH family NRPS accessory protein [Planomonospora sp. ID67723]